MKTLILNCGSTSIKFKLFDRKYNALSEGMVEKIGEKTSKFYYKTCKHNIKKEVKASNHRAGLGFIIKYLTNEGSGVIENVKEVRAVGHRVVHGGEISRSVVINNKIKRIIKNNIKLAPLHNPHNLEGIEIAQKYFLQAMHVAVFDTAFHQSLPEKAHVYALPYKLYQKYKIRRYGFHGISHQYVAERAAKIIGKPFNKIKIISCHLGAGSSITAINHGQSVDTSMGFTPLEGLVMATRTGDFDPAIIFYLQSELKMKSTEIEQLVNNKSGILGLSGKSRDMKIILKNRNNNSKCKLALDVYCYRVKKYIGAYLAIMGGLDALVFTAGMGENAPVVRSLICKNLDHVGIKLNAKQNNQAIGVEKIINGPGVAIKVLVIPTDEEKMIAIETVKLM